MKTKITFDRSIADTSGQPNPGMPIPGPRRPLGARESEKADKDTPGPEKRATGVSEALPGILSGLVPEKHIGMAIDDFKRKFPEVTDVAQIKGTEFFEWIDTLPLVQTARKITIV